MAEHVDGALTTLDEQWREEHPGAIVGHRGDKNHKPPSDHLPEADGSIDASDFMPGSTVTQADLDELAESLRQSRDYRIAYVIRRNRIFSSRIVDGVPAWAWRPYYGEYHSHTHVSRNDINETDNSEWELNIFMPTADEIAKAVLRRIQNELTTEVDPHTPDSDPNKLPRQNVWNSLGYVDERTKYIEDRTKTLEEKVAELKRLINLGGNG